MDYPPMLQTGRQRPKQDGCLPKAQKSLSKGAQLETTPPPYPGLSPLPLPVTVLRGLFILQLFPPLIYFFPYLFLKSLVSVCK